MRYASVMYLNPGCEDEYKKRHDELWPELASHLKTMGIRNYFIHLDEEEGRLYASFDADSLDTQALADHPVMQRWWEYMADIMATKHASFEPEAKPLKEVFRFNLDLAAKKHVVAVLDIGKTNIKICLMDAQTGQVVEIAKRPNAPVTGGFYPHVDADGIWAWVKQSLTRLAERFAITSVAITTHGATVACMSQGKLVMPILDYEFADVAEVDESYGAVRPKFSETFSPNLPLGLNLGRQIFWLQHAFPTQFASVDALLLYPQYWGYKLTGMMASEVTSLGCHTDLWNPTTRTFSGLVEQQEWAAKFPPMLESGAKLGVVLPELAAELGLPEDCVVFNGIHDSNASLVPYLGQPMENLTVISSGTWTVIATINGSLENLVEHNDMLANVDALGRATPTIRFMGGREWEALRSDEPPTADDIRFILANNILAIPSFASGGGPFAKVDGRIVPEGVALSLGQQSALADIYVAMMTEYCLELTKASKTVVIEGAFSNNGNFLSLLAGMMPEHEIYASRDVTGTSGGAAQLSNKSLKLKGRLSLASSKDSLDDLLVPYRTAWREALPL